MQYKNLIHFDKMKVIDTV